MTIMAKEKGMTDEEKAYYKAVGDRLDTLLDLRNLSQMDMERQFGIDQDRISKWTKGQNRIFVHQALALARALGVSLDNLFDDSQELEPAPIPSMREQLVREWINDWGWEAAYRRIVAPGPKAEPEVSPLEKGKTYEEDRRKEVPATGKVARPTRTVKSRKKKSSS